MLPEGYEFKYNPKTNGYAVWSNKCNRFLLEQQRDKYLYKRYFMVSNKGEQTKYYTSTLIKYYLFNSTDKELVLVHKDFNRYNEQLDNLVLCTEKQKYAYIRLRKWDYLTADQVKECKMIIGNIFDKVEKTEKVVVKSWWNIMWDWVKLIAGKFPRKKN
jgi:hypothetical protein